MGGYPAPPREVLGKNPLIGLMASGHGCYRFDLSSELPKMHKELVGGDAGKHNSPSNNSVCFRRIGSDRFVKPSVG